MLSIRRSPNRGLVGVNTCGHEAGVRGKQPGCAGIGVEK
jgi:hypothetical protein